MDETLPPKNPFPSSTTQPPSRLGVELGSWDPAEEQLSNIGPHRVVERLGAGGMGVVYKCEDPSLKRFAAVKVLRAKFSRDQHYQQRFRREAQTIASLSHPSIAHVYGIGETEGPASKLLYIVMEYIDGPSIELLLQRDRKLPIARALTIAREVALGLRAAFQKGIVHRDIKPSNLLVPLAGGVKIVDFGLAKEIGAGNSITDEGIVMGTPHYISPEQGRGRPVDHRSDIYSLGATLYHMVTGHPPFEGGSQVSIIVSHVNDAPRPPHEADDDVSAEASTVILRMMSKSPEERYATYDELIRDLEALLAGGMPEGKLASAETQPLPAAGRAGFAGRWRWSWWAGGAAAALLLVALGTWFAVASPPSLDPRLLETYAPWIQQRADGGVLLNMDFSAPPRPRPGIEGRPTLIVAPEVSTPGVKSPRLEQGVLALESYEHPFACGLRFQRIEELQVAIGATAGSFDLGIGIVDPDGSQRRFLLLRLRPAESTPEPILAMQSSETTGISFGSPLPPVPRIGPGPYVIFLTFEPDGQKTRLAVRIDKKDATAYRARCELEGPDWGSGIVVLATSSPVKPFSATFERIVVAGVLEPSPEVEAVPWRS